MPAPATNKGATPQGQFSHAVKVRLLELDLSVADLAREMGLNRNTVSRAIHHDLFRGTQARIAKRLKIQPPQHP